MKLVVCSLVLLLAALSASQKVKRGFVDHGSNATSYQQLRVAGHDKSAAPGPQVHQLAVVAGKTDHNSVKVPQEPSSEEHKSNPQIHSPNDKTLHASDKSTQQVNEANSRGQEAEHRGNAKVSLNYNPIFEVYEAHKNNFHGDHETKLSKGEELAFKLSDGFNPGYLRLEGGFKPLEGHTASVPEYYKSGVHHQAEHKESFKGFDGYRPSFEAIDGHKINLQNLGSYKGTIEEGFKPNFQDLDAYKNSHYTQGFRSSPLLLVYKGNFQDESLKARPHESEGYKGVIKFADSYQSKPELAEEQKSLLQYSQDNQDNTKIIGEYKENLPYAQGYKSLPEILLGYKGDFEKSEHYKDESQISDGNKGSFQLSESFKGHPNLLEGFKKAVQHAEIYNLNPQTKEGDKSNYKVVGDYEGLLQNVDGHKFYYQGLHVPNTYLKNTGEPKQNSQEGKGYSLFRENSGRSLNFHGDKGKGFQENKLSFEGQTAFLKEDANKQQEYYGNLHGIGGHHINYHGQKEFKISAQELNGNSGNYFGNQGYITTSHDLEGQEGHKGNLQGVVGYKINVQGPEGYNGQGQRLKGHVTGREEHKGNFEGLEGHQIQFEQHNEHQIHLKSLGGSQSEWKALDGRKGKSENHEEPKINNVFGDKHIHRDAIGVNDQHSILLGSAGQQSVWKGIDGQVHSFQELKHFKDAVQSLLHNGNTHYTDGLTRSPQGPQEYKYVIQSSGNPNGNIPRLSGYSGKLQSAKNDRTALQSSDTAFQSNDEHKQSFQPIGEHNIFLKSFLQKGNSRSSEDRNDSSQPKPAISINVKDLPGHSNKLQKIGAQGADGHKGSFRGLQGNSASSGHNHDGGVKALSGTVLYHI